MYHQYTVCPIPNTNTCWQYTYLRCPYKSPATFCRVCVGRERWTHLTSQQNWRVWVAWLYELYSYGEDTKCGVTEKTIWLQFPIRSQVCISQFSLCKQCYCNLDFYRGKNRDPHKAEASHFRKWIRGYKYQWISMFIRKGTLTSNGWLSCWVQLRLTHCSLHE